MADRKIEGATDRYLQKSKIIVKKAFLSFVVIFTLVFSLCACSQQDLEDMTSGEGDGYATIVTQSIPLYQTALPVMVAGARNIEFLKQIVPILFMYHKVV